MAPFRRPSPRHFASKATSIGRQSARPHNLLPDDGRWKKLQQPDFDVIDRGRPKQRTNGLCFARDGGLLSYGNDQVDSFRRAASYVDRILRGEKAGDLPVQLPTKFEMVLNLKTAKALGLTIPAILQATADEVIE